MGRHRLFGAAVVAGSLGLDCVGASPVDDVRDEGASPAPSASPSVDGEEPSAPEVARTPEPLPPATRYASMTHEACAAELIARGIPHETVPPRLGIASPVRLRGKLGGVTFRTLWPDVERARTSFEIIDCRLVLSLSDFAPILRAHGIVDVMFFSAYRPPPAGWKENVWWTGPHGPHEAGLAIDIGYFGKSDRTALNVERDFMPRKNERERICEGGPPSKTATPEAIELRKIACEAWSSRLFHVTLTPAYDDVHRDHFHLELAPDKTEFVGR